MKTFEELKTGDEVIVVSNSGERERAKVFAVGLQFITVNGVSFRRNDGRYANRQRKGPHLEMVTATDEWNATKREDLSLLEFHLIDGEKVVTPGAVINTKKGDSIAVDVPSVEVVQPFSQKRNRQLGRVMRSKRIIESNLHFIRTQSMTDEELSRLADTLEICIFAIEKIKLK